MIENALSWLAGVVHDLADSLRDLANGVDAAGEGLQTLADLARDLSQYALEELV